MYVNAILLGVLGTIFVEMAVVLFASIAYSAYINYKKKNRNK